jgi:hypothetical protein
MVSVYLRAPYFLAGPGPALSKGLVAVLTALSLTQLTPSLYWLIRALIEPEGVFFLMLPFPSV